MSHFIKSILLAFATFCTLPGMVSAQKVLSLQPPKAKADADASLAVTQRAGASTKSQIGRQVKGFMSLSDAMAYDQFVGQGKTPASRQLKMRKNPNAPEDSTVYHYTGFNATAGVATDGATATGGWVNFSLYKDYSNAYQPKNPAFACDTISSDGGASPYSVLIGNKVYSFLPKTTDYATYPTIIRTVYDANTMKPLSSKTFSSSHNGEKSYVPYMIAYDDQTGVTYAISIDSPKGDNGFTIGDNYYLNVLDTATCEMKRLGQIGSWRSAYEKGNMAIKSFCAGYGALYVTWADDSLYLGRINTSDFRVDTVGVLSGIPTKGLYGLQPMVFDMGTYKLIMNHYDLYKGTVYYSLNTYASYGSTDKKIATEKIVAAPTGFNFFFQRPATLSSSSSYKHEFKPITDFQVALPAGGNEATISFTTPDSVYADGTKMQFEYYNYKTLQCYLTSSNHTGNYYITSPFPRTLAYNTHYEGKVTLPDGFNNISVKISSSDYNLSVKPIVASANVVAGYDAPASVTDAKLSISGQTATITWTKPTTGRYADFGSTFDANDLTFKVVRSDGYVVDSTAENTVVDNALPATIQSWTYTIYPYSHGNKGVGVETNRLAGGAYMALPYQENFDDATSMDVWTVINADNNGSYLTWTYNQYGHYVVAAKGRALDDWLITPTFQLSADTLYHFGFQLTGQGKLRVTYGNGNNVEAQTHVLDNITATEDLSGNNDNYVRRGTETKDYFVVPTENGRYCFGLYANNAGKDGDGWTVDTVKVSAVAPLAAPDSVRDLQFVPDAQGALGGTFTFTAPTKTIGGAATAVSAVNVYDAEGNMLGTTSQVTAGGTGSVKVSAVHGFNTYFVCAANEQGDGYPVKSHVYVGPDVPQNVTNAHATWGDDDYITNINFDKVPTVGRHGGYVDPSKVKYRIYSYNSQAYPSRKVITTTNSNESVEIDNQGLTGQNQVVYSITAFNDEGESRYSDFSVVIGTPYTLPYNEPFASKGLKHVPYILYKGINGQTWTIDNGGVFDTNVTTYADSTVSLVFAPTNAGEASGGIATPIIDFTTASKPVMTMKFWHSPGISSKAFVTIDAVIDGYHTQAVADTLHFTGNEGWQDRMFELSKLKGKKAQLVLTAYSSNPADRIWASDWNVAEANGNDLAVTAISSARHAVVGDTLNVAVTVANEGAADATGYSVYFNVNDETVDVAEPTATLPAGKETQVYFKLPITAANASDIVYNASVDWDADTNAANNTSTDVDVQARQLTLNAPSGLAFTGENILAWEKPDAYDGYPVSLDFEDENAFETDNIAGWNTYDGDRHLSISFAQYYGNWWPYLNCPLAWMTWSTTEAGLGVYSGRSSWGARNGDKCLIAWGNFGEDASGYSNSSEPEDDWLISPELKGGSDLSFYIKPNDQAVVEVLTSSTGRNRADFTNVAQTLTFSSGGNWTSETISLPADAKYAALHVTKNGFGILVDDMSYTEAKAPKLLGYNVYQGTDRIAFVTTPSATVRGAGSYSVSAVYDCGESALSNVVTGITTLTADDGQATYYDLNGRLLPAKPAQRGVYIKRQNGMTHKVIIP
ncbi:MAG: choice-of-anchor J domain-containing protein [Prevotella sp.]|nr:choice-of-anchor J domain-containing protein [Prevotella sp.]